MSYRELHRRLARRRRSRGVAEEPADATVYRCLQPGRRRLDIELVADIVTALTGDESEAGRWRQAYAWLTGETQAAHPYRPEDGRMRYRETRMLLVTRLIRRR
jgi:hypothetical protein